VSLIVNGNSVLLRFFLFLLPADNGSDSDVVVDEREHETKENNNSITQKHSCSAVYK